MTEEEVWRAEVGARCAEARIAAGLSQDEVAAALACTPQLVSAQELGKSELKGKHLKVICPLYGKSSDWILFDMHVVPVIRRRGQLPSTDHGDVLGQVLGRQGAVDPAGV